MNPIYRIKLTSLNLLSIVLSTSVLITGCGMGAKENTQTIIVSQPVVKQLSDPSLVYLADATETNTLREGNSEGWMAIAKSNYELKSYSRALRAANEALSINNQIVEARQIAMLSAVKVMQSNIDAYHDNALMNSHDKATFKDTLTNMTTLVNTSD